MTVQEFTTFEEASDWVQTIVDTLAAPDIRVMTDPSIVIAKDAHIGYFRTETGPNGAEWPALKPETIRRKGHDKILVEHDDLFGSLADDNHPEAIRRQTESGWEFGTSDFKSEIHNEGSTKNNLPQRMHVGFSEELLDNTLDSVADNWVMQIIV